MKMLHGISLTVGIVITTSGAYAADVTSQEGNSGALVTVKLFDVNHVGDMDMGKNMGLGIGMKGNMLTARFKIEADKFAVPTGMVTFKVTNASDHMEHEMLVIPIADMETPLPYNDAENRVDEEAAHAAGEVAELAEGATGELTVDLKPGLYALICNIPGHYAGGMWRVLAVQ